MADVLLQYDHCVPVLFVRAQSQAAEAFLQKHFGKANFRIPKSSGIVLTNALNSAKLNWSLGKL